MTDNSYNTIKLTYNDLLFQLGYKLDRVDGKNFKLTHKNYNDFYGNIFQLKSYLAGNHPEIFNRDLVR